MRDLIAQGWQAALPVVAQKKAPLEFRLWIPGAPMVDGIWNIPIPRDGGPVTPGVALAPVVGFADGYRLGYGGGYYDRTLASLSPRPFAIALGYEFQRLETIYPQSFDQRFDVVVTDAGDFPITSAPLSTRIRHASIAAFNSVNTSAIRQAPKASGSTAISAATTQ